MKAEAVYSEKTERIALAARPHGASSVSPQSGRELPHSKLLSARRRNNHMRMKTLLSTFFLLAVALEPASAQAPADQRLREQLKAMTTQLRTLETEKATLQTEKTAMEEKLKKLEENNKEVIAKMDAEKEVAAKEREKLALDLSGKEKELLEEKKLHIAADAFGKKYAELAKKTEAERAKLAAENIKLKDTVAMQRTRNRKMYEIGTEILNRYAKFGLGTAITAREPFVGITRARLESMVEEYGAELDLQRILIDGKSPKPTPTATEKERLADGKPPEKKPAATKP
jgi:hypothetical protein